MINRLILVIQDIINDKDEEINKLKNKIKSQIKYIKKHAF